MYEKEIRFIDLFGGAGGFRKGLELAGKQFKCIGYYDNDKYAVQTYNKKFNESNKPTDITEIPSKQIPDHDFLCAGFPCQSFSSAGKRKGFKDSRGSLFFEIIRILGDKKPEMVLLENVKGLLSQNRGEAFQTILLALRELGYVGQYQVINSKNYGIPHQRDRVFIFGFRGEPAVQIFPIGESCEETNIPQVSKQIAYPLGQNQWNYGRGINIILYPLDSNYGKNVGTSKERRRTMVYQKGKFRRLTPVECERLQGFPDNWTEGCSDTQRYKQMGNAVTVNVIQAIGERILGALK